MNKNLRKKICTRCRLGINFCKNSTKENEEKSKIQRNKCVSFRRKNIKKYFKNISNDGVVTDTKFSNMIKPFLANMGYPYGEK